MIKYLVMDVDGTLTDGKIYLGKTGEICKAFNIKDGCGIHDILIPAGIFPVIITGRSSEIVLNRCKELGINKVFQGISDKVEILQKLTRELAEVAYIGDDINDLACINLVKNSGGKVGCPRNAVPEIQELVDFVADHNGGDGAVRDFIEWIVNSEQNQI